jgi:hypothetical protein
VTDLDEIRQKALDATDALDALKESLHPALSGNPQIDAMRLVEQHKQLTATIVQLLVEIAKQVVEATSQIESITVSNSLITAEIKKAAAQFDESDKCLIVGLAKLQEASPAKRGFSGKEVMSSASSLLKAEDHRSNCTRRMTILSQSAPTLLTTYLENYMNRFFLLTPEGLKYAKHAETEIAK